MSKLTDKDETNQYHFDELKTTCVVLYKIMFCLFLVYDSVYKWNLNNIIVTY